MKKKSLLLLIAFVFAAFAFAAPVFAYDEDDDDCINKAIGESVNLKGLSISVVSVEPYKEPNPLILRQLDREFKGRPMKYYAVRFKVLNGSRNSFEFNPYQFYVEDSNEEEFKWCISSKSPKFEGGSIRPGMIKDGFLVFGVPQNTNLLRVVVDPAYLYEGTIYFNLK